MPTQTFFRLPEEKRNRLIGAAWEEFSAVRFSDASINRIIRGAGIPRGSFYQYFEDKEDLFFYLLGTLHDECMALAINALTEAHGDVFAATPVLFDRLLRADAGPTELMTGGRRLVQLNQGMDVRRMLSAQSPPKAVLRAILKHADVSALVSTDEAFVSDVLALLTSNLLFALMEVLRDGEPYERARARLCSRVGIVRRGSIKAEAEQKFLERKAYGGEST